MVQALTLFSLISALRGHRERALELYQSAMEIDESPELLNNIGDIYVFLDKKDMAIDSYQRAIDISRGDRGDAKSIFSIANLYRLDEKYDEALDAYEHTLKLTDQYDSRAVLLIATRTDNAEFSRRLKELFLQRRPRSPL